MAVNGYRCLAGLELAEAAFGRLAAARRLAGDLDPFSTEASVVAAGLDGLVELACGVKALARSTEAVARLSGREHLPGMANECFLEIS